MIILHSELVDKSGSFGLDLPLDAPLRFPLLNGLSLVIKLLASGKGDLNFGAVVLQVHSQRYDGEALFLDGALQPRNLASVQQKLAIASRVSIRSAAEGVGGDVDIDQPGLAITNRDIAVTKVHASFPQRLDLRAREDDTSFVRVVQVVVMASFAVRGYCLDRAHTGKFDRR